MSVLVQNLSTGEVIDEYRADKVVPPASVMKLLTTGAALEILGPGYRFPTILEHTGTIEKGVLQGDLYIRGTCDPSLGFKGNTAFLDKWVKAIKAAGIQRIDGAVVADMTMLDGEAQNPSWLCEDAGNYYAPGIFALNYYGNTMNIVLKSGEPGSMATVVKTEPVVEDVYFINHVRCDKISYDGAFVSGLPYSRERYLTGAVPSNVGTFGVRGDLPNPGLLLVQHLSQRLEDHGITITAEPTYISEADGKHRTLLYTWQSPPLSEIIMETNIHSNNMYAESLFRTFGSRYSLPCTIHNSADFEKDYWLRRGVNTRSTRIVDGCGLAPQDAISAETLVQLLTYMYRSSNSDAFYASLPVSGQTGTLRSLLPGTPLDGKVHAKSGTIAATKNFAGYIELPDGRTWVFAVMVSFGNGKSKQIQKVIGDYLLDLYNTKGK